MPATDNQGSFLNLISIRRGQVSTVDNDQEMEDIDLFQKHVAIRFAELLSSHGAAAAAEAVPAAAESPSAEVQDANATPPPPFLSVAWFRNLLDTFLCCEAEFKAVLVLGRDPAQFSKPPLDRLIPDLLDRTVKALDICNAVTHGVELLRQWQKLAEIAVAALRQNPIGEGQIRRARKSLAALLTSMSIDDRENTNSASHKSTERNWSLGRRGGASGASGASGATVKDPHSPNFRPISWPVARSWSAAKQINAMSSNLVAPRGQEAAGPALPVYIMSTILLFVMWVLVAAIPCQERNGLVHHLTLPKQLAWAQPMSGLQEKIGEDWKKKEKKGTAGLLEEIQKMEKLAQSLVEFADAFVFPLEEDKAAEVAVQVEEMAEICRRMEEGLGPLQQQVREVFHKMVKSRAEVLEVVDQATKSSTPVPY